MSADPGRSHPPPVSRPTATTHGDMRSPSQRVAPRPREPHPAVSRSPGDPHDRHLPARARPTRVVVLPADRRPCPVDRPSRPSRRADLDPGTNQDRRGSRGQPTTSFLDSPSRAPLPQRSTRLCPAQTGPRRVRRLRGPRPSVLRLRRAWARSLPAHPRRRQARPRQPEIRSSTQARPHRPLAVSAPNRATEAPP